MTWTSFHRRSEVLRAVVAAANARRDGVLPLDVPGAAGPDAVFDDERDLVGALQLTWLTRLMGRIEHHQSAGPGSLEAAVVAAWHEGYDDLGGVRMVLDAARESDDDAVRAAMARATAKERLHLAAAAGLGNLRDGDEASVRVGARIEQRARDSHLGGGPVGVLTRVAPPHPSAVGVVDRVLGRLRSRRAA